jgi:flagellin
MGAESKSMRQALRNIGDGMNFVQSAEGGLSEIYSLLDKMHNLATQSANGSYDSDNRGIMDTEFQQLGLEIDRIVDATNFMNLNILNSSDSNFILQIGYRSNEHQTINIDLTSLNASTPFLNLTGTLTDGVTTQDHARDALDEISSARDQIDIMRGFIGGVYSRLDSSYNELNMLQETTNISETVILDADLALESAMANKFKTQEELGTRLMNYISKMQAQVMSDLL